MAAVRHGTVTIEFDPTRLNGPAKLKLSPHEGDAVDVELPLLDLLGTTAKLCACLGQLVDHVADAARQAPVTAAGPSVKHTVTGTVHGTVIQTGSIGGAVDVH